MLPSGIEFYVNRLQMHFSMYDVNEFCVNERYLVMFVFGNLRSVMIMKNLYHSIMINI